MAAQLLEERAQVEGRDAAVDVGGVDGAGAEGALLVGAREVGAVDRSDGRLGLGDLRMCFWSFFHFFEKEKRVSFSVLVFLSSSDLESGERGRGGYKKEKEKGGKLYPSSLSLQKHFTTALPPPPPRETINEKSSNPSLLPSADTLRRPSPSARLHSSRPRAP